MSHFNKLGSILHQVPNNFEFCESRIPTHACRDCIKRVCDAIHTQQHQVIFDNDDKTCIYVLHFKPEKWILVSLCREEFFDIRKWIHESFIKLHEMDLLGDEFFHKPIQPDYGRCSVFSMIYYKLELSLRFKLHGFKTTANVTDDHSDDSIEDFADDVEYDPVDDYLEEDVFSSVVPNEETIRVRDTKTNKTYMFNDAEFTILKNKVAVRESSHVFFDGENNSNQELFDILARTNGKTYIDKSRKFSFQK